MFDLEKHLAAYSAAKWSEWKEALAKDVIYEEIATHTRVKGVDEYFKSVERWKRAFPDLKATLLSRFTSGEKTFAEIEWEGTHSGPLETPFGPIAASNKRGTVRAAMSYIVKNDLIVEVHHYFDMMTVLMNIGVAPFAGVPAQPKQGAAPSPRH
ncbi:MAG TPA: ester cyclase [Kofleriaceae bacterium]|nr:ester cyclase [Kofleriaceae bacterium]